MSPELGAASDEEAEEMKATFKLSGVDQVDATMVLTMKMREWRELSAVIPHQWPARGLKEKIKVMLDKADLEYRTEGEA